MDGKKKNKSMLIKEIFVLLIIFPPFWLQGCSVRDMHPRDYRPISKDEKVVAKKIETIGLVNVCPNSDICAIASHELEDSMKRVGFQVRTLANVKLLGDEPQLRIMRLRKICPADPKRFQAHLSRWGLSDAYEEVDAILKLTVWDNKIGVNYVVKTTSGPWYMRGPVSGSEPGYEITWCVELFHPQLGCIYTADDIVSTDSGDVYRGGSGGMREHVVNKFQKAAELIPLYYTGELIKCRIGHSSIDEVVFLTNLANTGGLDRLDEQRWAIVRLFTLGDPAGIEALLNMIEHQHSLSRFCGKALEAWAERTPFTTIHSPDYGKDSRKWRKYFHKHYPEHVSKESSR